MGFGDDYLCKTGSGIPLAKRAADGKLPDILSVLELSDLISGGASDCWGGVITALEDACRRGSLKVSHFEPSTRFFTRSGTTEQGKGEYFVHRDDARRYFAGLNLTPPDDSPVACWLKGAEAVSKPETLSAQDRADFQQMCMEQWARNPTQTITGSNGVVQAVGKSYLVLYTAATLEKWARAVAPEGVRGVRGRRKKSDPE